VQPPKKQDDNTGDDAEPLTDLQKDLEEAQQEAQRLKELAARSQADLQNARGRMEKEAQDMRTFALEGIVRRLLPTVDNFQRAFAHLPEDLKDHDWVQGLQATEQAFLKELSDAGLSHIESLGQPVNADHHEVLQTGPGEKDKVIEVYEEGYLLHDKVLRPAKVQVGDGTDSPTA
jgi:molecular chaperone GrpE